MLVENSQPYPNKCYLPFVLYPPAMHSNKLGHAFVEKHLDLQRITSSRDFVLYVSIPFCRVQCKSCPYFIKVLDPADKKNQEEPFVDALIRDIKKWATYPRWRNGLLRSIFIGGGTGTILKTKNIKRIIDTIYSEFTISDDCSLTLEGNARDYDEEKLDYVANSQIKRVSLGVQSFNPELLKLIGSPHAAEESIRVIKGLQQRGFYNIQMDLIYNLPGHDFNIWKSDLETLKELKIKHFTIYSYRLHAGTMQDINMKSGKLPPMQHRESPMVKGMYSEARRIAEELGFHMYMFDHFCEPGYESSYNDWQFKDAADTLGIGPGSYTYVNNYRAGTEKDVALYVETVNKGEHLITSISDPLTLQANKERYVIFAFNYGLIEFQTYYDKFQSNFLDDFGDIVKKLEVKKLITVQENRIELTQLGKDWHINVFLEFFNPEYWGNLGALDEPNWAMNIPMIELSAKRREYWLGNDGNNVVALSKATESVIEALKMIKIDVTSLFKNFNMRLREDMGMDTKELNELNFALRKTASVELSDDVFQNCLTVAQLIDKVNIIRNEKLKEVEARLVVA